MLLEAVIFIGTICTEKTASTLLTSSITTKLLNLLEEKKEDDEIVLQTAFTLHKLLLYPQTRDELLNKTQVLTYLVDLLNDKNNEVRMMACISKSIFFSSPFRMQSANNLFFLSG